jgi:hypothetical protein
MSLDLSNQMGMTASKAFVCKPPDAQEDAREMRLSRP